MATPVDVPQFGNTVEECIVTRWVKRKGDRVSVGELVAEIETDKTTFEITAPVAGTMLETYVEEGAIVPVFTTICVIGEIGEQVRNGVRGGGPSGPPADGGAADGGAEAPPLRAMPADSRGAMAPAFSPRASRLAAAHDIHPASIEGSGPGGRVLEQDVRRALEASAGAAAPAPIRIAGTRHTIARRMRESLASTAQYTLNASASARGLVAVRTRLKASPATAAISINDLVAFCTVRALEEAPELNSEFIEGAVVSHEAVHLAFACDTPRGLVAPVVRNAQALPLDALARQMKDLAGLAVQGMLAPDDLSGATFTISNLGGLGVESFTPVLNPPQVAILGVGSIQLKPVRMGDQVTFVDSIGLSLTCDHQVIDGAPGARFLKTLREKIENVELLCQT